MKSNCDELGGRVLHVGRPNVGNRERLLARINCLLDRRWFSNNGPLVREFEERISEYVGIKHCIAMCNATVALEIASRALELQGEVILPAYTFVATAHAFQWQGITPVFADIDPATHNIDCKSIERLITPKTSAIIGVHIWGRPCNIESIEKLGSERGLHVMYDAAHAFGCSYKGKMVGNFGACEVFSFHATKFLNSFEGGAVVTNDDVLAEKMRLMRNFGCSGYDRVIYLGVNGKMTEICAAMGLTSLEALPQIVEANRRNYHSYQQGLADIQGITVLKYDDAEKNNYQYIVLEVDPDTCGATRDELVNMLHAKNVIARKYFWPGCHRMEPYRSLQPHAPLLLPETEKTAERVLLLPTGQTVRATEIEMICSWIRAAACRRRYTGAAGMSISVQSARLGERQL
jgi:dTDP-4-amino-4,6-dideoxygalactose transaminase